MAAMSDFLENRLIDFFFRGQALGVTGASAAAGTGPTNLYFGLLTAAPSDAGGGTEVSGGSYARVTVASTLLNYAGTQGAASTSASLGTNGTTSNNNAITFNPGPSANWGVVTHFGIYDALTGGNLLFWGALSQQKTINNGDAAPSFAPAAFTLQIDN
jgi:hypothetical protein